MNHRILHDLPDDLYRLIVQKWIFPSIQEDFLKHLRSQNKYKLHTVIQGRERAWSFFGFQIFYCVEQVNRLNRLNILQETLAEAFI